MEDEKLKKRKAMLTNSILPYFMGLSNDLMFFIAINSLFFTIVKGLSVAQITFLGTVSGLAYIVLNMPFLKIIQKIGNIKAIRLGTMMLLASSIIMTFANSYLLIILGYILYGTAFIFKKMDSVVLENNLHYLKRKGDFVKKASQANIIYSVITTVIAFISGTIFAINHYLPMYCCIAVTMINFLLSFCLYDASNEVSTPSIIKNEKIKFPKLLIILLLSYALFYATISKGQENSKLFIQYQFASQLDVGTTASYLGIVIAISRIGRIIGNMTFTKIYEKLKDKVSMIMPILIISAFSLILLGGYLISNMIIGFLLMSIGFSLILAVRDPFETYATDLLLKNTKPQEQQKAVSYLQLVRRVAETSISLLASIALLKLDLSYVMIGLLLFAMISLGINFKLYRMIKNKEIKHEI